MLGNLTQPQVKEKTHSYHEKLDFIAPLLLCHHVCPYTSTRDGQYWRWIAEQKEYTNIVSRMAGVNGVMQSHVA